MTDSIDDPPPPPPQILDGLVNNVAYGLNTLQQVGTHTKSEQKDAHRLLLTSSIGVQHLPQRSLHPGVVIG